MTPLLLLYLSIIYHCINIRFLIPSICDVPLKVTPFSLRIKISSVLFQSSVYLLVQQCSIHICLYTELDFASVRMCIYVSYVL
jgi:hypothetical protein